MQFPGMATDPVRMSLDVTWYPPSDDFQISSRLWSRPARGDIWQLESMATTGSSVRLCSLPDRWANSSHKALEEFLDVVLSLAEPFPDA